MTQLHLSTPSSSPFIENISTPSVAHCLHPMIFFNILMAELSSKVTPNQFISNKFILITFFGEIYVLFLTSVILSNIDRKRVWCHIRPQVGLLCGQNRSLKIYARKILFLYHIDCLMFYVQLY